MSKILSMVLAGGEGTPLYPLTETRAKASVPFGGSYRLIDFILSNCVNSNLMRIYVLTQFKSHSLLRHLRQGWRFSGVANAFIDPVPAQMRTGKRWYEGTADAIYQNLNLVEGDDYDMVCIFSGEHIYYMDINQMIDYHNQQEAALTVAALKVPVQEARNLGVIEVNKNWEMVGFQQKPKRNPKTIPGDPKHVLASMGNYVFNTETLVKSLNADTKDKKSSHDFGMDIIPNLYAKEKVCVYDFSRNEVPGIEEKNKGYWKNLNSLDMYWEANMDLVKEQPMFNLYNYKWPIMTHKPSTPPAKFVHSEESRTGHAINSIVASGSIISGSVVEDSVLGHWVRVNSFSRITESVILDNVDIGRGSRIRKTIIDKKVRIGPGVIIGEDLEEDRKRFHITENGVVVIPKGSHIE
ncbi:MAG: glucose-1-phosphate adenylyltransferase [SAR324 cluster bacterium]|nr:glucose-1-phosphate adenylyltransferase [SAR324 cluster bacterium]